MPPQNNPDRIGMVFDDHRWWPMPGLLLSATLAQHLGLREPVDPHLDPGDAPGRANKGGKLLTLVAFALAGDDCIDAADALCTEGGLRSRLRSQGSISTLGAFLRSFRWGHVRQTELAASCWPGPGLPGPGPGAGSRPIDLDSTVWQPAGIYRLPA